MAEIAYSFICNFIATLFIIMKLISYLPRKIQRNCLERPKRPNIIAKTV